MELSSAAEASHIEPGNQRDGGDSISESSPQVVTAGICNGIPFLLRELERHYIFEITTQIAVISSIVTLAMRTYEPGNTEGIAPDGAIAVETAAGVYFVLEAIIKLLGRGCFRHWPPCGLHRLLAVTEDEGTVAATKQQLNDMYTEAEAKSKNMRQLGSSKSSQANSAAVATVANIVLRPRAEATKSNQGVYTETVLEYCGFEVDDLVEDQQEPDTLWVGYFESAYDAIDCLVLLVTVIDLLKRAGIELYDESFNLASLRALRIMRAFKHVPGLDQVPVIVRALVSGLRLLANVMAILLFAYVVFTLVGIETLQQSLRRRCVDVSRILVLQFRRLG